MPYIAIIESTFKLLDQGFNPLLDPDVRTKIDRLLASRINAPLKGLIASLVAKLVHPEWDTRKHQAQNGGLHSLRSIDTSHVAKYLHKHGFYATATSFALTRSFENSHPYTEDYPGHFKDKAAGSAFLQLVKLVNEAYTKELCEDMLAYCLQELKVRKDALLALQATPVVTSYFLPLHTVPRMLSSIFNSSTAGISVIPVIALHTALTIVQPYHWEGLSIDDLKQHTAADGNSGSTGDIEGRKDDEVCLSFEVKHDISINDSILHTFDEKSKGVAMRWALTTKPTPYQVTDSGIVVGNVTDIIVDLLHKSLFHNKNIAAEYVNLLRSRIVNYENLGLPEKLAIDKVFTGLLAAPSPA
jgi:hypothetical protein